MMKKMQIHWLKIISCKIFGYSVQAFCSTVAYLVTVIFFYVNEILTSSPVASFYMTTFLWELVHMLDG